MINNRKITPSLNVQYALLTWPFWIFESQMLNSIKQRCQDPCDLYQFWETILSFRKSRETNIWSQFRPSSIAILVGNFSGGHNELSWGESCWKKQLMALHSTPPPPHISRISRSEKSVNFAFVKCLLVLDSSSKGKFKKHFTPIWFQ